MNGNIFFVSSFCFFYFIVVTLPVFTDSKGICKFDGRIVKEDCDVKATTVVSASLWVEGGYIANSQVSIFNRMEDSASLGKRRMFDVVDGGNLTLKNLILEGGQLKEKPSRSEDPYYEYGAIVRVVATTMPTVFRAFDCSFKNGEAYSGGGVTYANGKLAKIYMEAVSLKDNKATFTWGRGGAVLVENGATLEINQYPKTGYSVGRLTKNAIWNEVHYISGNSAPHVGGAIAALSGASAAVYGSSHIGFGDVLASPSLKNDLLVIENNNAGFMGGAFGAETGGNILVRGAKITKNKAAYKGGAFAGNTASLRAEQCNIFNNYVSNKIYGIGGGIFIDANARFVNVNSNYVDDYETASQPNYVDRSGLVGFDVAKAFEGVDYDVINMKKNPYGKNVVPTNPTNPNSVLIQIKLVNGVPVHKEVPLPLKTCDDDPGICERNGMVGPCVTNTTRVTYSSECRCPLGSILSPIHGCLLCPTNYYNDEIDATSCKPCDLWAPGPGYAKCSAPEAVSTSIQRYSVLPTLCTVFLALVVVILN
jgi:hypothetical protein